MGHYHASLRPVKPPQVVVSVIFFVWSKTQTCKSRKIRMPRVPYPPISRVAITMVASFFTEMTCKSIYEEDGPSCPNNGSSLFPRPNLSMMVLNTCKHDIKHKYMQRYYLHAMNKKFEPWEVGKPWVVGEGVHVYFGLQGGMGWLSESLRNVNGWLEVIETGWRRRPRVAPLWTILKLC